jgi:exopolysaccharide/PEP-CTERM locus tyrosine autokinase
MSLVERTLKKLQDAKAGLPERDVNTRNVAVPPPQEHSAKAVAPSRSIKIDRPALRAAGLLPPEDQERRLADQYRQIKRPLIANALGKGVEKVANGHLIMMASALPGEGKTFTSINLAMSLAREKDVSVLLIDADVAKPHISRLFGIENDPGLLDALTDTSLDVESMIVHTDVPGLTILSAGRQTETATELLASTRMEQVVARIGAHDRRRIVLVDSPPLLLTSESRALADVVGQVVLVVRAGMTAQQSVLDAISFLGEGKAIGLVLNQSASASHSTYYGYGSVPDGAAKAAE